MFPRQDRLSSVPPHHSPCPMNQRHQLVNLVLWTLLQGNHPEGPRLLMKTAEMWGSVGALGPRKNPF